MTAKDYRKTLREIADKVESLKVHAFASEWHCQRCEYADTFERIKRIQEIANKIKELTQ